MTKFVLGAEKTAPMQSLYGYHFDELKEFVKVIYSPVLILMSLILLTYIRYLGSFL